MIHTTERVLRHARGVKPEELLTFCESHGFFDEWLQLNLIDDDLELLQIGIMGDPRIGDKIPGTGGLWEVRVLFDEHRPPLHVNVRYVYFEEFNFVLLVTTYEGDPEEITPQGCEAIRDLIERQRQELSRRYKK